MHMFLLGFYKSFCKRLNDGVFRGITLSKYLMMIVNLLMKLILYTEYHLPRFLKQNVLFDKLRKYNVSCVYVTFLHMANVLYTFYIFFILPNMTKSRICYGVYILALRRLCCFCEKDDIAEEQAIRSHLVSQSGMTDTITSVTSGISNTTICIFKTASVFNKKQKPK